MWTVPKRDTKPEQPLLDSKPEQLMAKMTQAFGDLSVSTNTEFKITYANVVKIGTVEIHTDKSIDKSVEDNINKTIICEQWLRGYCKKDKLCDFHHDDNI